ncbi:MAG TPA: hypothetical protein PLO37_13940 [Candidatus Hydrogenedentes bacterium]|nr:hypothetical protein [Candidatus Hydrogenedentota bacterium]
MPGNPLVDFPLHLGLSIVSGVELPGDASPNGAHPVALSTHAVGKTALWRLIRQCLGEKSYGNHSPEHQARSAFPEEWASMESVVSGQARVRSSPSDKTRELESSKRCCQW